MMKYLIILLVLVSCTNHDILRYDENGKPHGEQIGFYDDSTLRGIKNMFHGVPRGIQSEYYENGELKVTTFCDTMGVVTCMKRYNKDKSLNYRKGTSFLYLISNPDSAYVDEEFTFGSIFSLMPGCSYQCEVGALISNEELKFSWKPVNLSNDTLAYTIKLPRPNEFLLAINVKEYDSLTNEVYYDTINLAVPVHERH